MKSNISRWTRKDQLNLCDAVSKDVDDFVHANGLLAIVAIARMCGWRKKRLRNFIKFMNEIQLEYAGYAHDKIFDHKLEMKLEEYGLTKEDYHSEHVPFAEAMRQGKRIKKADKLTEAEAMRLQKQFGQMKNYLESEEKKNEQN